MDGRILLVTSLTTETRGKGLHASWAPCPASLTAGPPMASGPQGCPCQPGLGYASQPSHIPPNSQIRHTHTPAAQASLPDLNLVREAPHSLHCTAPGAHTAAVTAPPDTWPAPPASQAPPPRGRPMSCLFLGGSDASPLTGQDPLPTESRVWELPAAYSWGCCQLPISG